MKRSDPQKSCQAMCMSEFALEKKSLVHKTDMNTAAIAISSYRCYQPLVYAVILLCHFLNAQRQ